MEAEVQIRLAGRRDAETIAGMSRELIEHGLPWRWRPEQILRLVRDRESAVILACEAGRIRGFAIMSFDWIRSYSHLVLLAVDPGARRRGVGRNLVRWLERVARRGGILRIGLEVRASSAGARRFYQSLGYTETGRLRGYYQGREDALKMVSSPRTSAPTS